MANPISSTSHATSAVKPSAKPQETKKKETPQPPQAAPKTAVTLSSAALAAAAASKEATETPAHTAQEARGNDHQAQALLARQQATAKAYRA